MLKRRGFTFLRSYYNKYNRHYCSAAKLATRGPGQEPPPRTEPNKELIDELRDKILFNSLLEDLKSNYGKRRNYYQMMVKRSEGAFMQKQRQWKTPVPLTLKYYTDDPAILQELENLDQEENREIIKQARELSELKMKRYTFPYARQEKVPVDESAWMSDYEQYKDSQDVILEHVPDEDVVKKPRQEEDTNIEDVQKKHNWKKNYGTPDPNAPMSDVQCGGCGASLHCKDSSIPGYLPSEIFKPCTPVDLRRINCQRCHFLKEYNLALGVSVRPQDYEKMLLAIRPQRVLVLLMVDLTDFPCSIWPNILDIIGHEKHIVIIGNKVDLIPQSSPGYLKHIEELLRKTVNETSLGKAKINHVSIISAKTGWGVERLITTLYKLMPFKEHMYIVGTTNVGKSSLFNALLQSDFCKVDAADLLQRATVSPWPGTTLNLLKFPISRPAGADLFLRNQRLLMQRSTFKAEEKLRYQMLRKTNNSKYATLIGNIERTIPNMTKSGDADDPFGYTMASGYKQSGPLMGIDDKSKRYKNSRWCYDTPGVVHPDQIITLLTVEELMCTLPKEIIKPRTFFLCKNQSLFVAGIARIDVLDCRKSLRLNVFSSNLLPVTVCDTEDADLLYSKLLGTDYFNVPKGNEERLAKWPKLERNKDDIEFIGLSKAVASGDIVLSSSGWVSVNADKDENVKVASWIVGGKGIYVRTPPLVERGSQMKGARIDGTPAYAFGNFFVDMERLSYNA